MCSAGLLYVSQVKGLSVLAFCHMGGVVAMVGFPNAMQAHLLRHKLPLALSRDQGFTLLWDPWTIGVFVTIAVAHWDTATRGSRTCRAMWR